MSRSPAPEETVLSTTSKSSRPAEPAAAPAFPGTTRSRIVELRSDTFTLPTERMRAVMGAAEVGNDDYGEDPTVTGLEETAAALLGKRAACLMPSGTMANLTAILVHCPRGSSLIAGIESDIHFYEGRGAATLGGVAYQAVPHATDGGFDADALAAVLPEDWDDPQFSRPSLLCLENPHNRAGGVITPPHRVGAAISFARTHGMAVHLDGARIFNAAVATGRSVADLAADCDSVQFCLSKGLGAPVGSMLAGSVEFITAARRWRKVLGGSMRQAGIVAAAGLLAITEMVDRLADDHRRAAWLGDTVAELPGISLVATPQTNVVLFALDGADRAPAVIAAAAERGVRLLDFGRGRIRATTHLDVTDDDIEIAAAVLQEVLR